jgi:molecular chaperone DnaJ
VPAGIEDGMRIRLSGQGEVGPGGGPAGDLYVEVAEQPHDTFTREGSNLHCTIVLPMTAAALGTDLVLTTLTRGEVDIRAGTQNGAVLSSVAAFPLRSNSRAPARASSRCARRPRPTTAGRCASHSSAKRRLAVNGSRSGLFSKVRDVSAGGDAKTPRNRCA